MSEPGQDAVDPVAALADRLDSLPPLPSESDATTAASVLDKPSASTSDGPADPGTSSTAPEEDEGPAFDLMRWLVEAGKYEGSDDDADDLSPEELRAQVLELLAEERADIRRLAERRANVDAYALAFVRRSTVQTH